MKFGATFLTTFVILFIPTGQAVERAALRDYKIDPEHSAVIFKVKNRGISYIYGRFKNVSGTIGLDRISRPNQIIINAKVKSRSLDTNSRKRDRHLKSKEFFNTTEYKSISFETRECKKLENNRFELTGEMTLLGKKKPLTVTFELIGEKAIGTGVRRVGGQTTFTLKRSDFGMNNMIPGIADEVTVMVNLEAQVTLQPAG